MGFLHADNPTYEDMALHYGEAEYPELWPDFAWSPGFGQPYSSVLQELIRGTQPGVLTNMDRLTDWVTSEGRWTLDYDGTNDAVVVTGGIAAIQIATDLTFSCWIKPNNLTGFQWLIKQFDGSADGPALFISTGIWWEIGVTAGRIGPAGTLVAGAWQLVTVTSKSDGAAIEAFLNGVSVATSTQTGANSIQSDFSISSTATVGGVDAFDGLIDDVLVWTRVLSAQEVRQLYSLGRGGWSKKKEQTRAIFRGVDIPATASGIVAVINVSDRQPTYDDMAKSYGEAEYPELWPDFAWSPGFGQPYGSVLQELINGKNHGTLTNMAADSDWVTSEGRWALDFDGTNDHIETSRTILNGLTHATIVWWSKGTGSPWGESGSSSLCFMCEDGLGNTRIFCTGTGGNQDTGAIATIFSTTTLDHFAVTRSPSQLVVYKNCVVAATVTAAGGTITTTAGPDTFKIGRNSSGTGAGDTYHTGLIDDLRVYRRVLSLNELLQDYSLGRGGWAAARRKAVVSAIPLETGRYTDKYAYTRTRFRTRRRRVA